MKNNHASDEIIEQAMEKLNKGQVKEGMPIEIIAEGLELSKERALQIIKDTQKKMK
jgi:hypothetical protein